MEKETPVVMPELQTAPMVLPPTLPRERMERFLTQVAHRLRTATQGEALQSNPLALARLRAQLTARMADEQRHLAAALGDEAFRTAMADAYASELANHQPGVLMAEARRETESILANRIEDCRNFIQLLTDPAFLAAAQALSMQPEPPAKEYALSAAKISEEVDSLVLPYRPTGPQPAVHVAMSARGHHTGHQALANLFKPQSGPLRAPLVHALATHWPELSAGEVEQLAQGWLKARHDPAHAIADALKPDGAIYTAAMAKAEALQREKLNLAAPAAPTTQTTQPRAVAGTLRVAPDMVAEL